MSKINLRGIEPNTDPSYRYKMHRLTFTKQSVNNILSNLDQVAEDIGRDPAVFAKYLEVTRNCKLSYKNNKYQLSNKITEDEINKALYEFIEYLVFCPGCRNPETNLSVKNDVVTFTCESGGEQLPMVSSIPPNLKKGIDKAVKMIK